MLIEIDDEVRSVSDNDGQVRQSIENLATAFREGKHIVAASRQTLARFAQIPGLGNATKATLRRISESSPQLMALPTRLGWHVRAMLPTHVMETFSTTGKTVVKVPITLFRDTAAIQPAVLLCEDLTDVNAYNACANYYKWQSGMTQIPTRNEPQPGGGANTGRVLSHILSPCLRLVLVIVDSDKDAPTGAAGSTARAAETAYTESSCQLKRLFVIPCKDVENIIPDTCLFEACSLDQNGRELLRALSELGDEYRNFFDLKEGLVLARILSMSVDAPARKFWLDKFKQLDLAKNLLPSCMSELLCSNVKECRCIIKLVPGLNLVTINNLTQRWGANEWQTLPARCASLWAEIGRFVFEGSCAWTPQFT
ncbi:MAG TPA: hypothetical protein VEH27_09355 [Methylomirabilota bacterium]|nr:hypothetical protein [Methylomirabilota bacterium]